MLIPPFFVLADPVSAAATFEYENDFLDPLLTICSVDEIPDIAPGPEALDLPGRELRCL